MSAPRYSPEDLVQDVTPEPHEFNVFVVGKYRVDLMAFDYNGSCTCPRFAEYGMASKLERGIKPSIHSECSHIRDAKRYYNYRALEFDRQAYDKIYKKAQAR